MLEGNQIQGVDDPAVSAIFVGTLVVIMVLTWVSGFAWAWLYNRLAG